MSKHLSQPPPPNPFSFQPPDTVGYLALIWGFYDLRAFLLSSLSTNLLLEKCEFRDVSVPGIMVSLRISCDHVSLSQYPFIEGKGLIMCHCIICSLKGSERVISYHSLFHSFSLPVFMVKRDCTLHVQCLVNSLHNYTCSVVSSVYCLVIVGFVLLFIFAICLLFRDQPSKKKFFSISHLSGLYWEITKIFFDGWSLLD